jgi:hypothetical protein
VPAGWSEIIPLWLQGLAAVVTAAYTIVLARLTKQLAAATDRMVEESARQREPQLVGRVEPHGPVLAEFVLTNIGGGPAKNVQLQLSLTDAVTSWRHVIFEPGRIERFILPGGTRNFAALADAAAVLHAVVSFENADGVATQLTTDFAFQSLRADWALARWRMVRSDVQELRSTIDKRLQEIVKHLRPQ